MGLLPVGGERGGRGGKGGGRMGKLILHVHTNHKRCTSSEALVDDSPHTP